MVNENGNAISYNDLQEWDTIEYSVDVMVPDTSKARPSLVLRGWRDGTITPSEVNTTVDRLSGLENETWKNFEGTLDVADLTWQQTENGLTAGLWFFVRANLNEVGAKVYMDNLTLTLSREVPPAEPEDGDEIPHSVERAGSQVIVENDTYKLTAEAISAQSRVTLNPYTGYIRVVFDEPLSLEDEWTLTYDLKTEGLVANRANEETWIRCFDSANGSTNANTVGFIKNTFTMADGTNTYTFSSADFEADGTSIAQEIASVHITFDTGSIYDAYVDNVFLYPTFATL